MTGVGLMEVVVVLSWITLDVVEVVIVPFWTTLKRMGVVHFWSADVVVIVQFLRGLGVVETSTLGAQSRHQC